MSIRTDAERKDARRKLAEWSALHRKVSSIIRDWSIEAPEVISLINSKIALLQQELALDDSLAKSDSNAIDYLSRNIKILESAALCPNALVETRLSLCWKQTELANAAKMPVQQLNRYELKRYSGVNLSTVVRLANALIGEHSIRINHKR